MGREDGHVGGERDTWIMSREFTWAVRRDPRGSGRQTLRTLSHEG